MILPEVSPAGEVPRGVRLRDARVPVPFDLDHPPRLLDSWAESDLCPQGRHLWDAIIAVGDLRLDDDEGEHLPFRLRLTCVRCGEVRQLAGVTDETDCRDVGQLAPVPLIAGELRAQQVSVSSASGFAEWTVHGPGEERVGFMVTGITPRRRRYVTGRLDTDHAADQLEATTGAACLRKLARAWSAARPAGLDGD